MSDVFSAIPAWQDADSGCLTMERVTLLALDTATAACSVALQYQGERFLRFEVLQREHNRQLVPMVQSVLREAGVGIGAVDAIAFSMGPGSFTGLRIAAGLVQGLAYGIGVPVLRISTLAALAQQVRRVGSRILVAQHARADEVFAGAYECVADGVRSINEDRLTTVAELRLPDEWQGDVQGPVVGVGDAFAAPQCREGLLGLLPGRDAGHVVEECLPRAEQVLELAVPALLRGEGVAAVDALPAYLRTQVATPPRG